MNDLKEIASYFIVAICVLITPAILFANMMFLADSSNAGSAPSTSIKWLMILIQIIPILLSTYLIVCIVKNRKNESENKQPDGQQRNKDPRQTFITGVIILCIIAVFTYFIFWRNVI